MAVVLDTRTVPEKDRAKLVVSSMTDTSVSSAVLVEDGTPIHARLDVWPLGRNYLFRAETSSVRRFRTERQVRRDPVPLLALAVHQRGIGHHSQFSLWGSRSRHVPLTWLIGGVAVRA